MEEDRKPDDTNDVDDKKEKEVESTGTEPGEPDPGGGDVIIIK
jgi:hypothetical protein